MTNIDQIVMTVNYGATLNYNIVKHSSIAYHSPMYVFHMPEHTTCKWPGSDVADGPLCSAANGTFEIIILAQARAVGNGHSIRGCLVGTTCFRAPRLPCGSRCRILNRHTLKDQRRYEPENNKASKHSQSISTWNRHCIGSSHGFLLH